MSLQRQLILASSSPRRRFLMSEVGFTFEVHKPDVEEDFPSDMPVEQVPGFLAKKKASYFAPVDRNTIVVTADTVVIINHKILNKPADRAEAIHMLQTLSGDIHTVITGVCIATQSNFVQFDEVTRVTFNHLTREQIEYYVDNFSPYDKAGSYGAQDCLPAGMNPCSAEELKFLSDISRPQLADQSQTASTKRSIDIIARIDGSYFNVMGLPIHTLYRKLKPLL